MSGTVEMFGSRKTLYSSVALPPPLTDPAISVAMVYYRSGAGRHATSDSQCVIGVTTEGREAKRKRRATQTMHFVGAGLFSGKRRSRKHMILKA
jgi:hypothetical protein